MIFKNSKLYDALKWIALVALDALGVAYESLAQVWNLPYGDEIMKTCTIVSILIGALIGVSSQKYNKKMLDFEDENAIEFETNEIEEE